MDFLGPFNNWYIIQLLHNSNPYEASYEIHQAFFYRISDKTASLVELVKYGAIKTTDTKTYAFYVIIFTSEAYILQDFKKIDGQIITAGKLVVK